MRRRRTPGVSVDPRRGGAGNRRLTTQWIAAEAERILASKFHAPDVWPGVRSRFVVLADPPDDTGAEWAEVLRAPQDAPIAAACVWHQLTHLVSGDKDLA